jgi:hypothetical protein
MRIEKALPFKAFYKRNKYEIPGPDLVPWEYSKESFQKQKFKA